MNANVLKLIIALGPFLPEVIADVEAEYAALTGSGTPSDKAKASLTALEGLITLFLKVV